jgi:transcriptional regulator with XRE-family HTH domain
MGTRLKMFREAAGLSQVRLAELAEVSPRTIQNWEYGKRSFDFETAVQLAKALGVSLDELAAVTQAETEPATAKKRKKKGGE